MRVFVMVYMFIALKDYSFYNLFRFIAAGVNITKTRLFKYTETFYQQKNVKFSDKKF